MPRKKRHWTAKDDRLTNNFVHAISDTFILPFFRLPMMLASAKPLSESFAEQRKFIVMDAIGALFIVGAMVWLGMSVHWLQFLLWYFLIFLAVMFVPTSLIGYVRRNGGIRRRGRQITASEVGNQLHKALSIMDTTAKWYDNEDEANRELVTCLKSLNVDAIYGYRLPNGRTADAKVGNVLVEGKLSPDTGEVDRLLGQLTDYTQYGNKVNIVVYGRLTSEARRRIENEIQFRYLNRVFLTYLNNPKRLRTQALQ